jgi:alpha-glucosidase
MGKERVDGLMILLQTLPGISFTYFGDEIGMEDNLEISWQDTTDPQACNTDPTVYQYMSREVARTPFQWNGERNAGFTTAARSWLPVHTNYNQINLERQMEDEKSHYGLFKKLLELRKEDTMENGDFHSKALSHNVFSYSRTLENSTYVVVINLGNGLERVDASVLKTNLKDESQIHVASTTSGHQAG